MEFVKLKPINRICPCCGNGNYMRIISGKNVGKLNVKCINCNSYYNYDELLKRDNSKPLNGADGRTMDDLISRAALLKECAECQKTDPHFEERGWASHFINEAGEPSTEWYCVEDMIENAPTVDAAPVKHGRWMKMTGMMPPEYVGHYECSVCQWHGSHHNATEREYRFCPRCGAKMDAEAGD